MRKSQLYLPSEDDLVEINRDNKWRGTEVARDEQVRRTFDCFWELQVLTWICAARAHGLCYIGSVRPTEGSFPRHGI